MKTDKELLIEGIEHRMELVASYFKTIMSESPDIDTEDANRLIEFHKEYILLHKKLNDLEDGE